MPGSQNVRSNPTELSFILDRMSPEQIKNYLEKQAEESEKKPKDLVGTWKDYLDMAEKLGLNVKDSIVYRVRKLELRHNEVIQMLKDKEMDLKADEDRGKVSYNRSGLRKSEKI